MELTELKIENDNLELDFSISENHQILVANVAGIYGEGSTGNVDGLYLFYHLTGCYFLYEPITIILDLRALKYKWGNTLLKSLNFFIEIGRDEEEMEKKVVVITSEENNAEIESLIGFVKGKGIVLTDQMNKAMDIAEKNVKAYLI